MSDTLLPILVLVILIFVNAFFAAAEIAVISLSEAKLKKQAQDGDKKAKKLLKLMSAPDNFLSAIQVAITLAGFLSSAFAADCFADPLVEWLTGTGGVTAIPAGTLNTIIVVLITVILSYFSLVFGELVPKRLAMKKTEGVARATVGTVSVMAKVFRPVIWLLSKSTNGVLRLFGVDPGADEESVSEDEIMMMVDLGSERGAIDVAERKMIENIFEFNNTCAEDIMIHRTDMVTVYIDDSHEEIVKTLSEYSHSRFPVCGEDADDIVGILVTREYLLNAGSDKPKSLSQLVRPAYFVPETVRTDALFRDMQSRKLHMAIVVDEYGGTAGIVTLEDLLEQIVGDIYDEFDTQEEPELEKLEYNLWKAAGSCPLKTISEATGVEFDEDEEYDTLGGLIYARLTFIPGDGEEIEMDVNDLHIRVTKIEEHRIEWAIVSKK